MGGGLLTRWWGPRVARVTSSAGYALWAPSYPPRPHNAVMEAEQAMVAPLLHTCRGRRALDVGTGTGRNLALLGEAGVPMAVGIDLSHAMLSRAAESSCRVRGDACRLPFKTGAFDIVTSSLMCGDIEDLATFIGEAARVLVPGGHMIYSDFHPLWQTRGWRRTFETADGRQYELPFWPHAIEHHLEQLDASGIEVCAIREPRVQPRAAPVVVVFHGTKRQRTRW